MPLPNVGFVIYAGTDLILAPEVFTAEVVPLPWELDAVILTYTKESNVKEYGDEVKTAIGIIQVLEVIIELKDPLQSVVSADQTLPLLAISIKYDVIDYPFELGNDQEI